MPRKPNSFPTPRGTLAVHVGALALVMALLSMFSLAQATPSPKIVAVSADINHPATLYVLFDRPYPSQTDVNSPSDWIIFVTTKIGKVNSVTKPTIVSVDASALNVNSDGEVVLQVSPPLITDTSSIDVTLSTGKAIVHVTASNPFKGGTTAQGPFKACASKGDCDIYLSGSFATSVGGSPLYSIDSFGGYMHSIREDKNDGKLGFYGQIQEKSSSNASPDSFLAYLDYQYVLIPPQHKENGTQENGVWLGPLYVQRSGRTTA